jgi:hypothetical protein
LGDGKLHVAQIGRTPPQSLARPKLHDYNNERNTTLALLEDDENDHNNQQQHKMMVSLHEK